MKSSCSHTLDQNNVQKFPVKKNILKGRRNEEMFGFVVELELVCYNLGICKCLN